MNLIAVPVSRACRGIAILLLAIVCGSTVHAVTINWVTVGDPGNAADTTGYGAVADAYRISKYEVTIQQYTDFLNAVAASDPYSLYNPKMATDFNVAGISRTGSSGSYAYAAINIVGGYSPNRPMTYVSWFDAARFANWMHNGQGSGSTETGAYTLNGATSGTAPAKNSGAQFYIPTENQWYKAAYYKGGGANAGYWDYATQSDDAPGNVIGNGPNEANYYNGAFAVTQTGAYSLNQNYLTDVGAFTNSQSSYGTFDQSGNVSEWNDLTGAAGSSRGLRGGGWDYIEPFSVSSSDRGTSVPSAEDNGLAYYGFRLASPVAVPEPSTWLMAGIGLACAGWLRVRQRTRMRAGTCRSTAATVLSIAVCLGGLPAAHGQTTVAVTNNNPSGSGSMLEALYAATLYPGPFTIEINPGLVLTPSSMYFVAATGSSTGTITINGNGATIDMSSANGGLGDRAFFIGSGTVAINNLSILNGRASGGNGVDGGGGGAGLGGAIFVANSQALTGPNLPSSLFTFPTSVTLTNVSIASSQAVGGSSLAQFNEQIGGGGGMGGNGGFGARAVLDRGGGGGGGFGVGANGGNSGDPASNGATGAFGNPYVTGSGAGAALAGGDGGPDNTNDPGGTGGQFGGGGGGAKTALSTASGAGGGVGGGDGINYFTQTGPGGAGGFGGGGGGAGDMNGGAGGFGGGGGGAVWLSPASVAGAGGFGGGGGGGASSGGAGGFGAGNGASGGGSSSYVWQGGGGLGAGGGIFVMPGASLSVVYDAFSSGSAAFSGNSVTSGTVGFQAGSAYGADLFLGANVTLDVATNRSLSVSSLGGAGNLADPNVANNASDPNAQGGIIKTGGGLLTLTGSSYYAGATTVHSGTLLLSATAAEQGTSLVTVGQNSGDNATLALGGSSFLALGGWNFNTPATSTDQPVVIAQAAGSTGRVVIGSGSGSNGAFIAARTFTGGSGTGSVVFTQQYAAEAGTNPLYPFYTSLTGSLGIVQAGLGTTQLQPAYGPNSFTGPVTVNSGTLATTGTVAALAGTTAVTVNGNATLRLGQTAGVNDSAALTLAGGVLQTGTSLVETLGALQITSFSTSVIDFLGNASTLNFASLGLASGSQLSIWNYAGANDFLTVATGTATGDLASVRFYGDSGSTLLGYGSFAGTQLVPVAVPEPSACVLALVGLGLGGYSRWRRRVRRA